MIIHPTEKIARYSKEIRGVEKVYQGYYIVVKNDAYWLGANIKNAAIALEQHSHRWLNDKNGYDYDIRRCYGHDTRGVLQMDTKDYTHALHSCLSTGVI